jgi:hypothetical protein
VILSKTSLWEAHRQRQAQVLSLRRLLSFRRLLSRLFRRLLSRRRRFQPPLRQLR